MKSNSAVVYFYQQLSAIQKLLKIMPAYSKILVKDKEV